MWTSGAFFSHLLLLSEPITLDWVTSKLQESSRLWLSSAEIIGMYYHASKIKKKIK